jgi:hypothetical protein
MSSLPLPLWSGTARVMSVPCGPNEQPAPLA